jgi:hypothetical protein
LSPSPVITRKLTNEECVEAHLITEEAILCEEDVSSSNSKMIWNPKGIVEDNQDHKKIPT